MPIRAHLPMPIHLDQLDHLILFRLDIGIQFLNAYPDVVLGVRQVLEGRTVEQQLQQE